MSCQRFHLLHHCCDRLHKIVQVDVIDWNLSVYPRVDPKNAQPLWACLTERAKIMELVRIFFLGRFSALLL